MTIILGYDFIEKFHSIRHVHFAVENLMMNMLLLHEIFISFGMCHRIIVFQDCAYYNYVIASDAYVKVWLWYYMTILAAAADLVCLCMGSDGCDFGRLYADKMLQLEIVY